METRGNLIRRVPVVMLLALLVFGSLALSAESATHHPVAGASKKCKKHRGKKRRCKRQPATPPVIPPAASPASISISPTAQDFGTLSLGKVTRAFMIANAGGSPSGVPVPAITGTNAASFSVGASTCSAPLPPGASCEIDVDLAGGAPAGLRSATLTVTAVPGGTVSATMTGDIED
jgi:hypothetical protein